MENEIVDFAKEVIKVLDNQKEFFKKSSVMSGAQRKMAFDHVKTMETALYQRAKEIVAAEQPQQEKIY